MLERAGAPRAPIGARGRYSNVGYLLAGKVLEWAGERPFEELVHANVLDPLGMTTTGFCYGDATRAVGYMRARPPISPLLRAALPRGVLSHRVGPYLALNPFLVNGPSFGGLIGNVMEAARLAALYAGDGQVGDVRLLPAEWAAEAARIQAEGRPFDHAIGWFRPHR